MRGFRKVCQGVCCFHFFREVLSFSLISLSCNLVSINKGRRRGLATLSILRLTHYSFVLCLALLSMIKDFSRTRYSFVLFLAFYQWVKASRTTNYSFVLFLALLSTIKGFHPNMNVKSPQTTNRTQIWESKPSSLTKERESKVRNFYTKAYIDPKRN